MAAWRAVAVAWDPKGLGVSEVLEEQAKALRLDERDRALARELAYGVLRYRLSLEHELSKYMEEPLVKKSSKAHDALLLGMYQILHLDRVPAHAAVSESVALVSSDAKAERFRGLVNAVLRKVASEPGKARETLPWPIRESIPQPVIDAISPLLPAGEMEAFASASNLQAPLCFRITRQGRQNHAFMKFIEHGVLRVAGNAVPFRKGNQAGPECLIVDQGGIRPMEVDGFSEGFLTVEDEGAQVAALLAATDSVGPVLDFCASPGGKTAHMADHLPEGTQITATDLNEQKLAKLSETLTRLGLNDRIEKLVSARILGGSRNGAFATVLVDAPCSGLGTLRRHPEIRYRFGAEGRSAVTETQSKLLREAARLVAPEGLLVYTVCTLNRAECEGQVESFLTSHGDFQAVGAPEGLPFDAKRLACGPGMWRTWPHRDGCDGFFIARFRRAEARAKGG